MQEYKLSLQPVCSNFWRRQSSEGEFYSVVVFVRNSGQKADAYLQLGREEMREG